MIRYDIYNKLLKRLQEKHNFIQVLAGPRQVGKTTAHNFYSYQKNFYTLVHC
jgi:predicted AAA+ superfamily ATPase